MPAKKGYYAYGIIAGGASQLQTVGGPSDHPIGTIDCRDLSVVVGDAPATGNAFDPESMRRHNRVISEVMRTRTIIPISFGTVFTTKADARRLLVSAHDEIVAALARLEGRVELGLKLIWKKDPLAAELEAEFPELGELKAEILALPPERAYQSAIELGQIVERAVDQINDGYLQAVYEPLRQLAVDARLNKLLSERMVFNAAFLVDREREPEFDRAVDALYEVQQAKFDFRYSGPWPPYNFVDISLADFPHARRD